MQLLFAHMHTPRDSSPLLYRPSPSNLLGIMLGQCCSCCRLCCEVVCDLLVAGVLDLRCMSSYRYEAACNLPPEPPQGSGRRPFLFVLLGGSQVVGVWRRKTAVSACYRLLAVCLPCYHLACVLTQCNSCCLECIHKVNGLAAARAVTGSQTRECQVPIRSTRAACHPLPSLNQPSSHHPLRLI